MITVTESFDDYDVELSATFTVDSMANAIGCEPEHASAYRGQFCIELQRCTNTATRKEQEPTAFQLERLERAVMEKIK